jgi:hypothetical protein
MRHIPQGSGFPVSNHARKDHLVAPLWGALLLTLFLTVMQLLPISSFATNTVAAYASTNPTLQKTSFTLDGVTVNVATPFLPGKFTTSAPGAATQVATAVTPGVNVHPFGAIYITAAPYGTKPKTEGVPIAQADGVNSYLSSLYQYRVKEGDTPQTGPTATFFGQKIAGIASLMHGDAKVAYSSTVVVEWVVEAGKRLWIVRITNEEPLGTTSVSSASAFLASLNHFALTSSTLSHVTTVSAVKPSVSVAPAVLSNYPLAPW